LTQYVSGGLMQYKAYKGLVRDLLLDLDQEILDCNVGEEWHQQYLRFPHHLDLDTVYYRSFEHKMKF
jgi:hypothetical protein